MEDFSKDDKSEKNSLLLRDMEETVRKMKPPGVPPCAIGMLIKNTALLPRSIAQINQPPNVPKLGDQSLAIPSPSGSATGNPRNKTALAPGHSLMDWIRLGNSGVDLTGVGGKLLTVTPAELAKHNKVDDAWIAIRGTVFNVTRYMKFHPGGIPELLNGIGKDATKLFDEVHAWVNYQSILQKCMVGRLERSINYDMYFDKNEKEIPAIESSNEVADPGLPKVKLDWRQTSHNITFLYATDHDDPVKECVLKKLDNLEFSLQMNFSKTSNAVVYRIKLFEECKWPPSWQRNIDTPQIEMTFRKNNRSIWKSYGTLAITHEKLNVSKHTYNQYMVIENSSLCKDVHLLVLQATNYIQLVPCGWHLEAKLDVMGMEVSRNYTPVPNWIDPKDKLSQKIDESCLCLIVKRYEDGALTPKLTALEPGENLELSNALGKFEPEVFDQCCMLHLLAAGTGLTPMFGVIKRALAKRNPPTINLINFNKKEDGIFCNDQLQRISDQTSLKVTHILSEAESTWSGVTGTVSQKLLEELIGNKTMGACIFTCGPTGFMEATRNIIQALGWLTNDVFEFEG